MTTTITPLDAQTLVDTLLRAGYGPFTGVPCSFLGPVISHLLRHRPDLYHTASNEGESVAIAAGAQLAGRQPVVILQNSGLGNAVNPLTSLCHTLRIPVLLLVTWRGEPGRPDEPQHELMGRITARLLDEMEIRHELLPGDPEALTRSVAAAAEHMARTGKPFAFVVPKGAVAPDREAAPWPAPPRAMTRSAAIRQVMAALDPRTLVVATTGKTARELERDTDRPENLYVVGSMGAASSVALGVALHAPSRKVAVLDGDGAALMRLEAMAGIGAHRPPNLLHVLFDNEAYESTGGQPTLASTVDFAAIALACGYEGADDVDDADGLRRAITGAEAATGPWLIRLRLRSGSDPGLGRPALLPPDSAARFRTALAR